MPHLNPHLKYFTCVNIGFNIAHSKPCALSLGSEINITDKDTWINI